MVRAEDIPNAVVLHSAIVNLSRRFGPALAGLLLAAAPDVATAAGCCRCRVWC